ncbi:Glyoxylase, beta-lactamase superfamily II [Salinibacillus kushneri]|uniref:Glyoxylase, beta-lactamase superfamily II n=1 Tax=Salinibacillus kushneri TaxID=237682 RepID=A0A1I0FQ27_9BACI|nr:MBL fold metallo-hydrolase [Salinibacillus kushneri]SET60481.1 Glyoxylase, beta-lactamase superfamily II [Salinibacillus kushneri]
MKILKNNDLYSVKIPVSPFFGEMSVYCYFIDGLLIDTGPTIQKRKLSRIYKLWDIQSVALTHHHNDHSGMVPWLSKHQSPKIFAHEQAGLHNFAEVYPAEVRTFNYQFFPISTPAHTLDHVCLLEPNKGWLFTGDLYITAYPKVFLKHESVSSYIDSLKKLQKLCFHTIFGGHEGRVSNGKEKIMEKIHYLEQVRDEVLRLHQLGYKDREIVKKIFPNRVRRELITCGLFSRLNLIRSCYSD